MNYEQMKNALVIISKCDCLSITEDDKKLIVSVVGTIMKSLREAGLVTTEMNAQYEILKISTWDDGYFCTVARQTCSLLHPIVDLCSKYLESEV